MRPTTRSFASAAWALAKPAATNLAFPAMASASSAVRSISRSVDSTKSGATRTSRLNPRAKALRATALRSAGRVAVTQMPRPGSRCLRSGTTAPSGATTNRIMSATGVTVPVAAQNRSVPGAILRGPRSRSSSCNRSCMRAGPWPLGLCLGCLGRSFGGRFGRRRREILFLDPAGLDPRLHDQRLGFLARQIEAIEDAGVLDRLAVLALGPADQVVGGAAGQILDRLDAILAETDHHP